MGILLWIIWVWRKCMHKSPLNTYRQFYLMHIYEIYFTVMTMMTMIIDADRIHVAAQEAQPYPNNDLGFFDSLFFCTFCKTNKTPESEQRGWIWNASKRNIEPTKHRVKCGELDWIKSLDGANENNKSKSKFKTWITHITRRVYDEGFITYGAEEKTKKNTESVLKLR